METPDLDGFVWRKSSRSTNNGACVEVGWRKSGYSTDNGACVEVALGDTIRVRDTKNRDGAQLALTRPQWTAFLAGAKHVVRPHD